MILFFAVTIDAHGEIVVGSGVQSGFVVDDGIVTAAHGVCEWDFVTLGFNVRPVFVVSIGGMLISQEVRVLAIDTGADLAYLEMPHLPEAFPLHIFPLAPAGSRPANMSILSDTQALISIRQGMAAFPTPAVHFILQCHTQQDRLMVLT